MAEDKGSRQGTAGSAGRRSSSGRGSSHRGFAAMDEERQREIAREGGRSVPDEKRSFSQDHELAAEAGRKGGQSVPGEKRSFSRDRELAAEAGRKGGESRGSSAGGRASHREDGDVRTTPRDNGDGRGSNRDDH
jgi:general stress protein YciG